MTRSPIELFWTAKNQFLSIFSSVIVYNFSLKFKLQFVFKKNCVDIYAVRYLGGVMQPTKPKTLAVEKQPEQNCAPDAGPSLEMPQKFNRQKPRHRAFFGTGRVMLCYARQQGGLQGGGDAKPNSSKFIP